MGRGVKTVFVDTKLKDIIVIVQVKKLKRCAFKCEMTMLCFVQGFVGCINGDCNAV